MRTNLVGCVLTLATAALLPTRASAQIPSPYEDPRYQAWSRAYAVGDRARALGLIEADLRSASPHPLATCAWVLAQEDSDAGLRASWESLGDPVLRRVLEAPRAAVLAYRELRYEDVLAMAPPDAAAPHDECVLRHAALAAGELDRTSDVVRLYVRRIERDPTDFLAVWNLGAELVWQSSGDFRGRAQAVAALRAVPAGAARDAALTLLAQGQSQAIERLGVVDAFLAVAPGDPYALAYRGLQLGDLDRHGEAADVYERAQRVNPFRTRLDSIAEASLRAGDRGRAERAAADRARLTSPHGTTPDCRRDQYLAQALFETGDRGEARQLVTRVLARCAAWSAPHELMCDLELTVERWAQAAPHALAALERDASPSNLERAMRALRRSGDPARALQLFAAHATLDARVSTPVLSERLESLAAQGLHADRLSAAEEAARWWQHSPWMAAALARAQWDADRKRDAIAQMRAAVDRDVDERANVDALVGWIDELNGEEAADACLRQLRTQHPWHRPLWDAAAERMTGDDADERRIALAREEVAANPGDTRHVEALVWRLIDAERWDDALREAQGARGEAERTHRVGDVLSAAILVPWLVERRARVEPVASDLVDRAFRDLERYAEFGGTQRTLLRYRQNLLYALGRNAEAAEAAYQRWLLDLDDGELLSDLLQSFGAELSDRLFPALHRYFTRDPYDWRRLNRATHWHTMWGGSPLVALQYARWMEERAPDHVDRSYVAMSLGNLGDHEANYTGRYHRATSISDSDRYIGWFENARMAALGESSMVSLSFDRSTAGRCPLGSMRPRLSRPDAPYAVICDTEGRVIVREDDVVTGKRLLLQQGELYVQAVYDDQHRLVRVESSAGTLIEIAYADPTHPSAITEVAAPGRPRVRFVYGRPDHRPTRIEAEGLGAIDVTYSTEGEIQHVESSGGRQIALEVTSTFQTLLSAIRHFETGRSGLASMSLPEPAYDALVEAQQHASFSGERARLLDASFNLLRYLAAHLANRASHADRAMSIARELFVALASEPNGAARAAEAIRWWHAVALETRPRGLPREEFEQWRTLSAWLQERATDRRAPQALRRTWELVRRNDLVLREPERWLGTHDYSTAGFWARSPIAELTHDGRPDVAANAVLHRANGDLVVGTDRGLAVRAHGYWRWFGLDETRGRLSSSPDLTLGASSRVLSLAESADGVLWIGTANGLIAVRRAYEDEINRWRAVDEGVPEPGVRALAALPEGVLVGTARGAQVFRPNGPSATPAELSSSAIVALDRSPEGVVTVSTADGVWLWTGDAAPRRVIDGPVEAALFDGEQVFFVRQQRLWSVRLVGEAPVGVPLPMPGTRDIQITHRINGLARAPGPDGEVVPIVLTDQGVAFWGRGHFEHLRMPLSTEVVPVTAASTNGSGAVFVGRAGVYRWERDLVRWPLRERVHDVLTVADAGVTVIAAESGLYAVRHDDPAGNVARVDFIRATELAPDGRGGFLANDGTRIIRYDAASGRPRDLFDASPTSSGSLGGGPVRAILAASDGTIWAAAGGSVFRHDTSGRTDEFSFFTDPARFPSRTHMISNVVETITGEIWVIGSNESHIHHRGIRLAGGVLEWDQVRSTFRRIELERWEGWFITSYTPVDERFAISGTTSGFYRHARGDRYVPYAGSDTSYDALRREHPSLFLGRRGARVGDGLFLFPTAAGVVGYHRGQWFYPERLNWMLPDQPLAPYGSRVAHAVAVDPTGRIYVGTDRGLTVYDAGATSEAALLASARGSSASGAESFAAFDAASAESVRAQQDALLSDLPRESPIAQRVARIADARREIETLEDRLAATPGDEGPPETMLSASDDYAQRVRHSVPTDERERLARDLRERRRRYAEELLRVEREDPGLFRMIEVRPLELSRFQEQIPQGDAIVQYLPTRSRLYIHVLRRDEAVIREVDVSSQELMQRSRRVGLRLGGHFARAERAAATHGRATDAGASRPPVRGVVISALVDGESAPDLDADLRWLYDRLLRPIARDLRGTAHVHLVRFGALTYLPFGALIGTPAPERRYAVEDYRFGHLSDLHLWDVAQGSLGSSALRPVVFADPDGSLRGARAEAEVIASRAPSAVLRLGPAATLDALVEDSSRAGVLHLATHGFLDSEEPARSWLLLANGERLTATEAMTLPLDGVGMVVLSACQTGVGRSGLEYATLSRAFFNAGAASVVATLWMVPDHASRALVESFYGRLDEGADRIDALTTAQREMIASEDASLRHPASWAGYVFFGRP